MEALGNKETIFIQFNSICLLSSSEFECKFLNKNARARLFIDRLPAEIPGFRTSVLLRRERDIHPRTSARLNRPRRQDSHAPAAPGGRPLDDPHPPDRDPPSPSGIVTVGPRAFLGVSLPRGHDPHFAALLGIRFGGAVPVASIGRSTSSRATGNRSSA
jgi:hypothetical protein